MKIQKIIIHNFRSIKDQELILDDYSVLFGQNNAGKSNIINAIRFFFREINSVKYEENKSKEFYTENNEEFSVQVIFVLSKEDEKKIENKFINNDNGKKTLKLKRFSNMLDGSDNIIASGQRFIELSSQELINKIEFCSVFNYENNKWEKFNIEKIGNLIYIFESYPKEFFEATEQFYAQQKNKKLKFDFDFDLASDWTASFFVEKIVKIISLEKLNRFINEEIKYWGWKKLEIQIKENSSANNFPSPVFKCIFINENTEYTGSSLSKFSITQYGQGFQRFFFYSLKKILKEREFNNQKSYLDFTLTLFEEPEIFLHRESKILMNQNFNKISENPNQQVLITTHDPVFIASNSKNQKSFIRIFKNKNETEITQIKIETIKNSQKIKHLISFDNERSAMFLANHVIICEGQTEKAFFSYMLNHEDEWKKFSKENFYILDALGKGNIPIYMELCNDLKIKHSVLFDLDTNENGIIPDDMKKFNRNIKEKINFKFTKNLVMFWSDFEKFLGIKKDEKKSCKKCGLSKESKPIKAIKQYINEIDKKELRLELITNIFNKLLKETREDWKILNWDNARFKQKNWLTNSIVLSDE